MTNTATKCLGAVVAATCLVACGDLNIPDLNNPGEDVLLKNPTRTTVSAAAIGLLIGHRADVASPSGYVVMLGILGREAYYLDSMEPRFVTEMLAAPQLDPGDLRFGGGFWVGPYANIRNANVLYAAIDKLPVSPVLGFSEPEKQATLGFAKTIQALDFLVVINTHDVNGAVIDVGITSNQPGTIVSKEEVFAHIADLLDQAKVHLAAGGAEFPFQLGKGFTEFDTPATFLKFNRALKARVEVYRGEFQAALDALDGSFLDRSPEASLDRGTYFTFGTSLGETRNAMSNPELVAHPSLATDAERKSDNSLDNRVARKIHRTSAHTLLGLTSDWEFTLYPDNTSQVPIIRNEELILLHAEANIGLAGIGLGDLATAAEDINFIRVKSGGLAPRTDLDASNILDELLKQKRYSLLLEGGHRWIDMRRYGRLEMLPKDLPTHSIHPFFPIPLRELDARK